MAEGDFTAMASFGTDAIVPLVTALSTWKDSRAAAALTQLGTPAAIDALVEIAQERSTQSWGWLYAALALSKVGQRRIIPVLMSAVSDLLNPGDRHRCEVLKSLGLYCDVRALPALLQAMDDPCYDVRLEAVNAVDYLLGQCAHRFVDNDLIMIAKLKHQLRIEREWSYEFDVEVKVPHGVDVTNIRRLAREEMVRRNKKGILIFACQCASKLCVTTDLAGRHAKCPACGRISLVPMLTE